MMKHKAKQEFVDKQNYNNLCARSTLYPGVDIEDIPVMTIEDFKPYKMKREIISISYNEDRKSVTIHFNKKYNHTGLGSKKLIKYLVDWTTFNRLKL
ncbi:hypothetical protein LCGC14_2764180 [marine sediment metagenome]|uniref:Uncharacterized protein n=1 Tax=marine sediment metagenome TaxID=412755 RepID=A0A0F8YY05_9ZZZZ